MASSLNFQERFKNKSSIVGRDGDIGGNGFQRLPPRPPMPKSNFKQAGNAIVSQIPKRPVSL
jgi:hypothetical protein